MKDRSERINDAIEKSGYSYVELSKITGISKSTLQRYATGETKKIPIDNIEKIAKATNTDSRYLMGWEDEPEDDGIKIIDENDNIVVYDDETRDIIDSLRTRPEMKILFSVTRKATKEDILKAVKIIEALKEES